MARQKTQLGAEATARLLLSWDQLFLFLVSLLLGFKLPFGGHAVALGAQMTVDGTVAVLFITGEGAARAHEFPLLGAAQIEAVFVLGNKSNCGKSVDVAVVVAGKVPLREAGLPTQGFAAFIEGVVVPLAGRLGCAHVARVSSSAYFTALHWLMFLRVFVGMHCYSIV